MFNNSTASVTEEHFDRPQRRHRRPPPGFVAVADLAAKAECAPSTIYDNIAKGRITASRWRGLIIIADDVADAFLMPQPLRAPVMDGAGHE